MDPEIIDLLKASAAVGAMILMLVLLVLMVITDEKEKTKKLEEKRAEKFDSPDQWHLKHFDGAYQFQKWMNDPKNKPIYFSEYGPDDFIVFPLGKDGFDVVYKE